MLENRNLRKIPGHEREEVVGSWRRLVVEELHNLHASSNIIWTIKAWRLRWAGHVARMRDEKFIQYFG
jgi:hypothetical protein